MISNRTKLTALAGGVALAVASMATQAADQPVLPATGPLTGASFSGGATINDGASFLAEVPATEAFSILATINPAPGDVGSTGNLVIVVEAPGVGQFAMASPGTFVPWDQSQPLQPFATKILESSEEVVVVEGLVGIDAALTGVQINVYAGYYTSDQSSITYTGTPVSVTISSPAANTCPANTTAAAGGSFKDKPVCILTGRIESDTHLTSNFSYLLDGQVIIGGNVAGGDKTKLTIDAGSYVFGQTGLNFLVIDRNGQIHANGSRAKPIIFTYEGDDSADALTRGQWGGLVINGSAPINEAGGEAEGEGASGLYGGNNPADNSGSMTYVQVKYAGQNFTETNELNGIALQAVGSGTNLDYIQVHNNSDDGIEFFGGSANARHLVLTGNEDDALDWTLGWDGKVQFVAVRQTDSSEHCIEADNNDDNNDATPRSNPTIANMTCVGDDAADGRGIRLREGTSAFLTNFVVSNFVDYCADIDQTATFVNAGGSIAGLNGNLILRNSRFNDANCTFEDEDGDPFTVTEWFNAQTNNALGGVDLGGDLGWVNGSALNAVTPAIPADPFFESVDHIGAVKDESSDWTAGWTYRNFLP